MAEFDASNHFGWQSSAMAWLETVEADPNRTHLLDPILLDLCGDVSGQKILDVGCGNGRFCKFLTDHGALCFGIDVIPDFILAAAKEGIGEFLVGEGASLPFQANLFDLAISYLTILDIEDYQGAIGEMARVLKRGGRCIVATVHPMVSSIPCWFKDENGEKLYWRIDRYFEERGEVAEWSGIRVFNWHRPQEAYFRAFFDAGFTLTNLIEPKPTTKHAQDRPAIADNLRVPNFIVYEWKKL
jgi:ubiquinone/menaquinone biosynthesis C-methylase UbiE